MNNKFRCDNQCEPEELSTLDMKEERPNKNKINKIIDECRNHMSTKGIQETKSCVMMRIFF